MNHSRILQTLAFLGLLYLPAPSWRARAADDSSYDVVIYGGTAAGIVAAVQVKRMGGSVVVVEPGRRIGGLTTGGLGQTDIGNKAAIGGIAREFYQRVRKHYQRPESWIWQRREEYSDSGQSRTGSNEEAMWTFEPSAALSIMQDLVREFDIPVIYEQQLDRTRSSNSSQHVRGVTLEGKKIVTIKMESGLALQGRIFLDATYEGDLLAGAGVSYTVGRESNEVYSETLNGVQTRHAKFHQFMPGVDPYVVRGDASSGLLPGIDATGVAEDGSGDRRIQAFCFRMCLTDHPENRIPFARPKGYDPLVYELLLRNFEAGESGMPWINSSMPNRKTDTNNRTAFSTDFIGHNYDYPEGSYAKRRAIIQRHREYQQGLMWTLANHPRVPNHIRREVARWGMCRDEFERQAGWQQQLYVREARRMTGAEMMTQYHCQGRKVAEDAIGLAAYTMDSHNVQRYVDANGHVRNEGDVEVGGFSPYPISYGSLTPKPEQCENLLVPVCLSASHIAFGSIRMEPVFMVLGQSAATAAMQAIEADVPVQAISYDTLRQRLLADGQVLVWNDPIQNLQNRAWEKKEKYTEWTSLFNGKDLDGWAINCLPQDNDKRNYWKVVNGAITAEVPPGSQHNYIWLLSENEYGDFELRMKVQTYASSTGNSGIQVRSRYDEEVGWLDGPQVDINPPGPWRCGFIYDETREAKVWLWPDVGRPANAKPEHAPEGWKWFHADDQEVWNDVRIVCNGTGIKTIMNGVTIADYDGAGRLDDEAHRSHKVGLQGHIGLQIHPGKQMLIRFKDIEVRKLERAR